MQMTPHTKMGYEDILGDKPFSLDYNRWTAHEQQDYEDGRLLGAVMKAVQTEEPTHVRRHCHSNSLHSLRRAHT